MSASTEQPEAGHGVLNDLYSRIHVHFEAGLMSDNFQELLETFDNPHPNRDYVIETICPEFTAVCPKTGQPDYGTITITYIADAACFELKSLKMYLQQYRNHGAFHEDVTNLILNDLVAATKPRWMRVDGRFNPRGGIRTNVSVEHRDTGFTGTAPSV